MRNLHLTDHKPLNKGGAPQRKECWQGGGCGWWTPRWHKRCDKRVHSMPCQSSERHSTDGEALLSLWQPRPLHPWLPMAGGNEGRCTFKPEREDSTEEERPSLSRKDGHAKGAPGWGDQGIRCQTQTPILNPNPFNQWYGIENVARVRVNGESCMSLLDNSMQINTIMPGYVENHSLNIGPHLDLVGGGVACIGFRNAVTQPIGYVIIWIQVDRIQGYDEDQIALVMPDLSNFAAQFPVILGTPTIGCIMNVIKESEMDNMATSWVNAQVAYLLAVQ